MNAKSANSKNRKSLKGIIAIAAVLAVVATTILGVSRAYAEGEGYPPSHDGTAGLTAEETHVEKGNEDFFTSGLHLDGHTGPDTYQANTGKNFTVTITYPDDATVNGYSKWYFPNTVPQEPNDQNLGRNDAGWRGNDNGTPNANSRRYGHGFKDVAGCESIVFADFASAATATIVVDYPYIGDYNGRKVGAKLTLSDIEPMLSAAGAARALYNRGERTWGDANAIVQPAIQIADIPEYGIYMENIHTLSNKLEFYYIDNAENREAGLAGQNIKSETGGKVDDIFVTQSSLSMWRDNQGKPNSAYGGFYVSERAKPLSTITEGYVISNTNLHKNFDADDTLYSRHYDQFHPFLINDDAYKYSEQEAQLGLIPEGKSVGDYKYYGPDGTPVTGLWNALNTFNYGKRAMAEDQSNQGWYASYTGENGFEKETGRQLENKDTDYNDKVGDQTFTMNAVAWKFADSNDIRFAPASTLNTMWYTIYPQGLTNMTPHPPTVVSNDQPLKNVYDTSEFEANIPKETGYSPESPITYTVSQEVNHLNVNSIVRYSSFSMTDILPDEVKMTEDPTIQYVSYKDVPTKEQEIIDGVPQFNDDGTPKMVVVLNEFDYPVTHKEIDETLTLPSNAGSFKYYTDESKTTTTDRANAKVVEFVFDQNWLQGKKGDGSSYSEGEQNFNNTMPLEGETYQIIINGVVSENAQDGTDLVNKTYSTINGTTFPVAPNESSTTDKVTSVDRNIIENLDYKTEEFVYTVSQKVPIDATSIKFTDALDKNLQVEEAYFTYWDDVRSTWIRITGQDALNGSVTWTPPTSSVQPNTDVHQLVTGVVADGDDENSKWATGLRGKTLTLVIKARIRPGTTDENLIVYDDSRVPNSATVSFNDDPQKTHDTNEVYVVPPYEPEKAITPSGKGVGKDASGTTTDGKIVHGEKKGVHVDTGADGETFTYSISQAIPAGTTTITISDQLHNLLEYVKNGNDKVDVQVYAGDEFIETTEVEPNGQTITFTLTNDRADGEAADSIAKVVEGPGRIFVLTTNGLVYQAWKTPEQIDAPLRGDWEGPLAEGSDGYNTATNRLSQPPSDTNVFISFDDARLDGLKSKLAGKFDGKILVVKFDAKFSDSATLDQLNAAYQDVPEGTVNDPIVTAVKDGNYIYVRTQSGKHYRNDNGAGWEADTNADLNDPAWPDNNQNGQSIPLSSPLLADFKMNIDVVYTHSGIVNGGSTTTVQLNNDDPKPTNEVTVTTTPEKKVNGQDAITLANGDRDKKFTYTVDD